MLKITTMKSTGMVIGLFRVEEVLNSPIPESAIPAEHPDITLNITGDRYDSEHFELELTDALIVNSKYPLANIVAVTTDYLFHPEFGFRLRPYFRIDKVAEVGEDHRSSNFYSAKINTNIKLKIYYFDPDDVGYFPRFDWVKFKDRMGLVDCSDFSRLDFSTDRSVEISVQSAYPGLSLFRAKDDQFLCKLATLGIKFRVA